MRIRLITGVWGEQYVDTFLRTGLRSLLSKGNAPDLASAHDVVYTIYTTYRDAETLQKAPAFARLRATVDVRLSLFDPWEIDTTNYGEHGTFWWRGMDLARRNGEVLFFIIPDLLYANGTLVRWAERFVEGKRAIFTIGPQVVLETIVPELEKRFPGCESPYDLDRDQLLDLLDRHLHPLHAAMRHDARRRPSHPEYDLRLVPKRGMVIREIVSHPFCVHPSFYSALKHYGPEDHLDTLVFEPCSTVSVEPILKRVHGYYRPWPLDEIRLSNLGGWWDCFTTAACERESTRPFELVRQEDDEWRVGRSRAIAAGGFYRSQVVAAGKIYQLFAALRTHGYFRAANMLAAAVYAGRLRRRIGLRRRAIILVPTDEALSGPDGDKVRALLQPGREREFLDLIGDHILLGKDEIGPSRRLKRLVGQWPAEAASEEALVTARGLPAAPLLDFARSAAEPIGIGPFTIYPVDRVVWRETAEAHAADMRNGTATSSKQPMSTPPPDARRMGGTFVVTRWARKTILHRTLYFALHTPFVEPFAALLFPFYFKVSIKNRLRPYRVVDRMRAGLQRAKHVALRLSNPWSALHLAARVVKRIPVVGNAARTVFRGLRFAKRQAQPCIAMTRRAVGLIRRDGLGLAARKVRAQTIGSASPTDAIFRFTVSPAELEKLRQIRSYRALKAIEAVLVDCQEKMSSVPFRSAPLVFLRQLLARHGLDGPHGSDTARSVLMELVERHPYWAEPWLELGFMHEDEGAAAEALRCFERAMHGKRAADLAPSDPDPGAVAAANRGRLLMAMDRQDEARAAFAFAVNQDPGQKVAAVQYAGLLRREGNIDKALVYYGEGMYYQECRWCLPAALRDAARVSFQHLARAKVSALKRLPGPLRLRDGLRGALAATSEPQSPSPAMPNGIHICIVVYGASYTGLLAEILLANLAAMVLEIPEDLRALSRVRIVTTDEDIHLIEYSPALPVLRQRICVEILNAARLSGYEKHGNYGPMVESQRIFVVDAARENAALFFVGPDQVYSRGSFALFVDRLRRGYRVIIGPGPRAKRETARAELRELIAASPDCTFAPESDWLIDLFFRHWHPVNDQFLIEHDESIWWKAYVCNRPHPDELLFRFFQGPTFVAWPRQRVDNFDGFIDHELPELCCNSWREVYVVDDARHCLALDLTREEFVDVLPLAEFPRVYLLQNLFNAHAIKDLKLIYGLRTCRLYRGDRDAGQMHRRFDRVVDPLILLALAERTIRRRFGSWAAFIFRNFCILNTHTLGFVLRPFSARLARKWKDVDPLAAITPSVEAGAAGPKRPICSSPSPSAVNRDAA